MAGGFLYSATMSQRGFYRRGRLVINMLSRNLKEGKSRLFSPTSQSPPFGKAWSLLSTSGHVMVGSGIFAGLCIGQQAHALGKNGEKNAMENRINDGIVLRSRIRGDMCRLAPNLSDLVADITELLKEKHSIYIEQLSKHRSLLEKDLETRRNAAKENNHSVVGSEIDRVMYLTATEEKMHAARREYRSTLDSMEDVMKSVQQIVTTSKTLGADSCVGSSESVLREAMFVRDSIIRVVRQSEENLAMVEKLYKTRLRREEGRRGKVGLS